MTQKIQKKNIFSPNKNLFNVKHAIAWNIYSLVHSQSFKEYQRV